MKASHIFLIIAAIAIGWVFFRGGEDRYGSRRSQIDYSRLAVSQGLTAEAAALNLEPDLDVALLPEIGKQVIREAAQAGLTEQAFLQQVIQEVSNRIREISTIDLNGDDVVDPILIKPEPLEGEQFVMLSIRVPAHDAYPLPDAGDSTAWKDVETIEVATMTISMDKEALTVQAQGNQHVYPRQAGQHYVAYDRSPSFLQMYVGMRMMEWMFFPRYYGFYGPGFGYGMYRPMGVPLMASRRAGVVSSRGYSRSTASTRSAISSRAGGAPRSQYSRAFPSKPPRSLNQLGSSAKFQRRQAARVGAGGFARSSASRSGISRSSSSFSRQRGASRTRIASTRRSIGRRGFGGFGRRGFGGGFRFRR